ncbi:hypothetical protein ACSBR2_022002 [Camellia fascicularis]
MTRVTASRPLLGALVERWWDTTNSFHFSTMGEMTMTPYDFAMITGIGVGGDPIPLDPDMEEWEAAWIALLGARPPILRVGMVRYSWFEERFTGVEPKTIEHTEWNTVGLYLLSALVVLQRVSFYDWGGAGLTTLYGYMSSTSRMCGTMVGGYWRAWELWEYAYFPTLAPEPIEETPATVLFSRVYDGQLRRRTWENFMFFR